MKIKKFSASSVVGVLGSAGLLSLLAIGLCCPISAAKDAHAATCTPLTGNGTNSPAISSITGACAGVGRLRWTADAASEVEVTVGSDTLTLDLLASDANKFASRGSVSGTATVKTTNSKSYKVYATANSSGINNSNTDTNSMISTTNTSNSGKINAISTNKTLAQMSNEWGLFVGEASDAATATYKSVPTVREGNEAAALIKEVTLVDNSNRTSTINLNFGAGITSSLTPDTYGVNVIITAVADPGEAPLVDPDMTMQDFAANDVCKGLFVHDTVRLKDLRDNKYYWITKMADDNCWMSQNLDTDIAVAGSFPASTGDATNKGFNTTGAAYVAMEGAQKTTLNGSYAGNSAAAKNVTVYNVNDTAHMTKIDATNTDLADGVTEWGNQTSMVAAYKTAYSMDSFNTFGAAPTAYITDPDAVSSPSQLGTYSWDEGMFVINNPIATTSCGSVTGGLASCALINGVNGATTTGAATTQPAAQRAFVDVSTGYTPSSDPEFTAATTYIGTDGNTCTKTIGRAVANVIYTATGDERYRLGGACAMYDAHYLVGNYYQWNAATVSSGGNITNTNAKSTICPKGWTLPLSGTDNNNVSGSFYNMLVKYGVTQYLDGNGADGLTYNIALAPLWYVRTGSYYPNNAKLEYTGILSWTWSRSSERRATAAYYLGFGDSTTVMSPSANIIRYSGIPLRCLHQP